MAEHRCKTPLTSLVPYNDLQTAAPSHAAVWQRRIPRRHSLVDAAADGRKPSVSAAGIHGLHRAQHAHYCTASSPAVASQDSMRESSDHVAHDREPFDTDAMCIANHADSSQMHPPR